MEFRTALLRALGGREETAGNLNGWAEEVILRGKLNPVVGTLRLRIANIENAPSHVRDDILLAQDILAGQIEDHARWSPDIADIAIEVVTDQS